MKKSNINTHCWVKYVLRLPQGDLINMKTPITISLYYARKF